MTDAKHGGCLCKAVRYTATPAEPHYHACHCDQCRGWGGPVIAVAVSDMKIEDESKLTFYGSSDYAERGFCTTCGTHIVWRMKDLSFVGVPIGTLDDDGDGLVFGAQFFIDKKPAHYTFANETENLTGEELFAAMTGGAD